VDADGGRRRARLEIGAASGRDLAAKSQAFDDFLVFGNVGRLQVVEQLATLIDQLHQTAAR
jgi:hypothetical protein